MRERDGLITTTELAGMLDQPDLRLFDCTTYLEYQPEGSGVPYIAVPGRHTFEAGHIPGADFLDLQGEFSDQNTELRFMMPDIAQLEAAFGRHGIGADSRVVLYSIGTAMWATRFWWMLKSLGFDNAACSTAVSTNGRRRAAPSRPGRRRAIRPRNLPQSRRAGYFVGKHDVLAARTDRDTVVVNALGPQFHKGLEPSRYGRPGRIPGSVNVSAATLFDPQTKAFAPLADAEAKFAAQGITQGQARGRLLRRRHLRHHRPVPAVPARLRQPHALRRLDGRMGQGCLAADRDGLALRPLRARPPSSDREVRPSGGNVGIRHDLRIGLPACSREKAPRSPAARRRRRPKSACHA